MTSCSLSFRRLLLVLALLPACATTTSTAAAGDYVVTSAGSWRPADTTTDLYRTVIDGAGRAGVSVVADSALDATARGLAGRIAADPSHGTPNSTTTQAFSWAAGVADPIPALLMMRKKGQINGAEMIDLVTNSVRREHYNRVGVATVRGPDGVTQAVVALTRRRMEFTTRLPQSTAVGDRLPFRGRLEAALQRPELLVTGPDGRGARRPLGPGPEFTTELMFTQRGAYQIELIATGAEGATVVINVPIYVGVEAPPLPVVGAAGTSATGATEDPAVAEELFLQLINEARRSAGRRPLQRLPALAAVARAHSEEMAARHYIAHVSPVTGSPTDRVKRAQLPFFLVSENIGRGKNTREIHSGLLASPGHRANLLNDRITHAGIGVVRAPDTAGGLIVTENFLLLP